MTAAGRLAFLAALALAPAYLNDFLYMRAETIGEWLAADYGSKVLVLVLILAFPDTRRALDGCWDAAALGRQDWRHLLAWTIAVTGLIVTAFLYLKPPLDALAPAAKLFVYPEINDPAVRVFDLTAGLVLTAVAEELAFRALMRRALERFSGNTAVIVLTSASAFAAIHWSNGLGSLAVSFIAGGLLMVLYIRNGSLVPAVVAHYAADLILFL